MKKFYGPYDGMTRDDIIQYICDVYDVTDGIGNLNLDDFTDEFCQEFVTSIALIRDDCLDEDWFAEAASEFIVKWTKRHNIEV